MANKMSDLTSLLQQVVTHCGPKKMSPFLFHCERKTTQIFGFCVISGNVET